MPKWEPKARLGIYLGPSDSHASTVAMILNPFTGLVSPQYYVKYDDEFKTTNQPPNNHEAVSNWKAQAGLIRTYPTRRSRGSDLSATETAVQDALASWNLQPLQANSIGTASMPAEENPQFQRQLTMVGEQFPRKSTRLLEQVQRQGAHALDQVPRQDAPALDQLPSDGTSLPEQLPRKAMCMLKQLPKKVK